MPKLREIEIDYEQVRDLVCQLAFEKRGDLISRVDQARRCRIFDSSLVRKGEVKGIEAGESRMKEKGRKRGTVVPREGNWRFEGQIYVGPPHQLERML
jgi:hypothetical protein